MPCWEKLICSSISIHRPLMLLNSLSRVLLPYTISLQITLITFTSIQRIIKNQYSSCSLPSGRMRTVTTIWTKQQDLIQELPLLNFMLQVAARGFRTEVQDVGLSMNLPKKRLPLAEEIHALRQ